MFWKGALAIPIFLISSKPDTNLIGEYYTSKGLDSYRLTLAEDGRFSHSYSGCTLGFEAFGEWNFRNDTLELVTTEVKSLYSKAKQNVGPSDELWKIATSIRAFVVQIEPALQLEPLDNGVIFTTVSKVKP